ncbi:DsbA family protein [Methylocapsa sp. D3K7]|uniref:DsbA family protein n=1 Tax=Methylocapsa sp. D3K7 TaxID=3041435 RepID=UPI00244ECAFC|nr:DsbA family protein [Methylocapsa sp. D3K7]WGJ15195.1 DsbA family protein [Methylocapsa sp. D3K7]
MFLRSLEVSRLHAGRLAVLALGVVALACTPVRADGFSAGQKADIESIIKDYLMQKPEVLREAIGVLEAREKAAETKARQDIVADPSGLLFSGANQAVIGNPGGKITLIEFFDYNCGYCKRALNDLARLMKDNPDLRVVLRDLPILSPGSVEAARVANAARLQFKGDKFWEFHQKLLGSHGPVGKAEALAAAKELGADMKQLEKDAAAPATGVGIEESEKLAKSLQVTGTPSYVIGGDVVVGAVGYDDLQAKVANIKKCGKAICS